uniref:Helicase ATP-binding domain-containing protein n=1 Tax=Spongospora subterranea TaxID=70186 RepID=A0A0H5R7I9_9EUKA|eukprot:CRZ10078.1 hypothetical protein [Spongospora subterranea]
MVLDQIPKPAKQFSFDLDDWQKEAIDCIDAGQSVMVAAHTSAGKTSVAEYAIAASLRDSHRVIYTSPVKALSNQKFRELQDEFGTDQVGLKTGDLSLNPDAPCLVMTTEILRNMLYRGAVEIQEVKWIIFDEIHYMRDRERGVVWEEAIILCPPTVQLVFLSATLANADQFAGWVSQLKGAPCKVIQTTRRPTPLHHYVFVKGEGEGIYLISDPNKKFQIENFNMAIGRAQSVPEKARDNGIGRLFSMLVQQNYYPAIVFSFSRRECEAHAITLTNLNMNSEQEQALVQEVFDNALSSLSEEDRSLPQARNLLSMLKQGIGVHHGGMLPILKEVVELLFQESLVKVLCATETFALGVNMPAKTVVFTAIDKFDGQARRALSSSEYIQMSGRAGRRNRDPFGLSILMINQNEEVKTVEALVDNQSDPLVSQFRLSYNSILNMTRSELHNPDLLLANSFHAYLDQSSRSDAKDQIEKLVKQSQDIVAHFHESGPCVYDQVAEHVRISHAINESQVVLQSYIHHPKFALPFMQPGRVVYINPLVPLSFDLGWGVLIACKKLFAPAQYYIDVLLNCNFVDAVPIAVAPLSSQGQARIVRLHMDCIKQISTIRMLLPDDLLPKSSRVSVISELQRLSSLGPIPVLDIIIDQKVDAETADAINTHRSRLTTLVPVLSTFPEISPAQNILFEQNATIQRTIEGLKVTASDASSVRFRTELKSRLRLLRRLHYVDADGLILPKGRLACEIDSLDEILATELMVDGVFTDLDECETAAFVSCLQTEQEKGGMPVPSSLTSAFGALRSTARRIGELSVEVNMPLDVESYVGQFTGAMAAIVLNWSRGMSFHELCQKTTVFEGSIIRTLRRLQEVLVQLADGAQSIGNDQLHDKFERARQSIFRGIPFAGSLYL